MYKWFVWQTTVKICNTTAPTCFGAVKPSSGSSLSVLAKVTVVKTVNSDTSVYS